VKFQYTRVNRQRTCLICGKPDWCSYSPDGKISFCARIVANADRISRTGWGVFYHEKSPVTISPVPFPNKFKLTKPELAPIEIRDFVYRKLIELSPSSESRELIEGTKGLRERGILDFVNYGSLPKSSNERDVLAKLLRHLVNAKFPDFVREHLCGITRVPGFWIDKTGKARLWLETDGSQPMMLIPYRDPSGLIQACQLRFMGTSNRKRLRYVWLSTPRNEGSVTSGSPLHFGFDFGGSIGSNKPIMVTEGALKAQTVQYLRANVRVLGNGGVTCSHEEIISNSRFSPLVIAFDIDYLENHLVARAIAKLLHLRLFDAKRYRYSANVRILWWESNVKGIDDVLLRNIPVKSLTIMEWIQLLDETAQGEALDILQM
jgi:hypothetical protein